MDKTAYLNIVETLESDLGRLKEEGHNVVFLAKRAVGLCLIAYSELQTSVLKNGFESEEEEIYFFKYIKPRVCSKISFYRKQHVIESQRPKSTPTLIIEHLIKEITKLQIFLDDHSDFIKYYRGGETILDDKYFTRNITAPLMGSYNHNYLLDPQFSTVYDGTLADILAYESLEKYLANEIHKLQGKEDDLKLSNNEFVWTGKLTWLAELIYGIVATGVVNNGNISVNKLIKLFSKIFNLPSDDIYNAYRSVYSRKKEPLIYIEKMREAMLIKINEKYK